MRQLYPPPIPPLVVIFLGGLPAAVKLGLISSRENAIREAAELSVICVALSAGFHFTPRGVVSAGPPHCAVIDVYAQVYRYGLVEETWRDA